MSLRQIKVTECEDCPFMNTDSNHIAIHEHVCRINECKEIPDINKTPDWCPLMNEDYIEVSHNGTLFWSGAAKNILK